MKLGEKRIIAFEGGSILIWKFKAEDGKEMTRVNVNVNDDTTELSDFTNQTATTGTPINNGVIFLAVRQRAMMDSAFEKLEGIKIGEYRLWARENYKPLTPIDMLWHPVIREECRKINAETKDAEHRAFLAKWQKEHNEFEAKHDAKN